MIFLSFEFETLSCYFVFVAVTSFKDYNISIKLIICSDKNRMIRPRGLLVSSGYGTKSLTTLTEIFVLMHSGIVNGYQLPAVRCSYCA